MGWVTGGGLYALCIVRAPTRGCHSRGVLCESLFAVSLSNPKTTPNTDSVAAFIESIAEPRRKREAHQLVALLSDATGEPTVMWGRDIVGFGSYHYRYASGREADWMRTGFSQRKAKLSIYLMDGVERHAEPLAETELYTNGVSGLYVESLDAVGEEVMSDVIRASVAYVRETMDKPS